MEDSGNLLRHVDCLDGIQGDAAWVEVGIRLVVGLQVGGELLVQLKLEALLQVEEAELCPKHEGSRSSSNPSRKFIEM